jgi:large conductance mechanosensitive channel
MNIQKDVLNSSGVKKAKGFFNEFKAFISQGNILDLAVGVVIGTAFKAIVSSLVSDIFMPAFGALFGSSDISDLKWIIRDAAGDAPEVAIKYGLFIKNIIDFLIISFCLFIIVKVTMGFRKKLDALKKKEEEEAKKEAEAIPTKEDQMLETLTEIRDLLKDQRK